MSDTALRSPVLMLALMAASAGAQIPGAPVLQNAWATPGVVGAIDVGGGADGSAYAAAASWSPGSGRFQLSGGAGIQHRAGAKGRGIYGVRVAVPLGGVTSTFGFAAFAGLGGGAGRATVDTVSQPCRSNVPPEACGSVIDSMSNTAEVPVGLGVGWRHAIGGTHGLSVYATPAYVFYSGGSKRGGLLRMSIGVDLGVTSTIGATLGAEFGGRRPRAYGGPSGSLYGFGVSYALGHR